MIRQALASDIQELQHLCLELGYMVDKDEIQERLDIILQRKDHILFIYEHTGEVAGFIHAFEKILLEQVPTIEIGGLSVHKKFAGQGIGKALVQAVQISAQERNIKRVIVKSNIAREQAHGFYTHVGFIKKKTQHVFEKQV